MPARDAVCQRASEGVGEGCGREEDANAEAEFVAEVEEGEEEGDGWAEAGFGRTEEES